MHDSNFNFSTRLIVKNYFYSVFTSIFSQIQIFPHIYSLLNTQGTFEWLFRSQPVGQDGNGLAFD